MAERRKKPYVPPNRGICKRHRRAAQVSRGRRGKVGDVAEDRGEAIGECERTWAEDKQAQTEERTKRGLRD